MQGGSHWFQLIGRGDYTLAGNVVVEFVKVASWHELCLERLLSKDTNDNFTMNRRRARGLHSIEERGERIERREPKFGPYETGKQRGIADFSHVHEALQPIKRTTRWETVHIFLLLLTTVDFVCWNMPKSIKVLLACASSCVSASKTKKQNWQWSTHARLEWSI